MRASLPDASDLKRLSAALDALYGDRIERGGAVRLAGAWRRREDSDYDVAVF